jgi:Fe-S cluster assembly protein SufB
MAADPNNIEALANQEYKYGFVTEIEADSAPPGLNEDIVRLISAKKNEWRLQAYRHWLKMKEPAWANVSYPAIDYQAATYYSAPRQQKDGPKSLEEVDPELLRTYEKLGIPLHEREKLAGVAVDAVFDSVSVATTFRKKLAELGIIFCSFSEAVQEHPELVRKWLGSVVPYTDNFNSAVFSDGSFCYIPKGVRCPMELSTYFRINAKDTGQFERTLIVAEEGSYVSYLEGCTAPIRDTNQLHAAVVELVALDDAQIKYSTVQNWYPGDKEGKGGIYNFVTKRGRTGTRATRKARAASTTSSPSAASARARTPRSPGRRWRPAPPSPGNTPAAFCRATTPSASFTPSPSPITTSRPIPAPR